VAVRDGGKGKLIVFRRYRLINWRRVAKRVVSETWDDDVFGRAGQLAFFWLFSLFPLLLIITVILGYLARGAEMREALLAYLGQTIPGASFTLVRDTLTQVSLHAGAGKLWIGVGTTVWAASSGMTSVIYGLNKAYEVPEARPYWKARILAIVLTIVLAVLIVLGLIILLYGGKVGAFLGEWLGFSESFRTAWAVLKWFLVVGFVLAGFLIVYRFAPNLHNQKLLWILPGAVSAVGMWVAASLGLRVYLNYFTSYNSVYGALGAVLVLLLWIYVSSSVLLIGGEINSEIENAAAKEGVRDAKRPGERAPREPASPNRS
jgi:membrane protein